MGMTTNSGYAVGFLAFAVIYHVASSIWIYQRPQNLIDCVVVLMVSVWSTGMFVAYITFVNDENLFYTMLLFSLGGLIHDVVTKIYPNIGSCIHLMALVSFLSIDAVWNSQRYFVSGMMLFCFSMVFFLVAVHRNRRTLA